MDPDELIDAKFEKAVSIVQSLPKTGPIQTGYEEKLAMYSLYKQATVGNVKTPRPGVWDMLGRAKWDAWAKRKDLGPQEAKCLYVETLLKVLQKYSDKTVARDLVRELEAYGGDLGGSFAHLAHRRGPSASGSSGSESAAAAAGIIDRPSAVGYNNVSEEDGTDDGTGELTGEGGETSEDDRDEYRPLPGTLSIGDPNFRSSSSVSSQMRYRTPMAGSTFSPPPMIPSTQPLPAFATPSAFGSDPPTIPPSATASTLVAAGSYPPSTSYPGNAAYSRPGSASNRSPHTQFQAVNAMLQRNNIHPSAGHADQRTQVERAVENVQAHIAALTERVEMLESSSVRKPLPTLSSSSVLPASSHSFLSGSGSGRTWDPAQMGLWSLVIAPLTRVIDSLRAVAFFLAYAPFEDEHQHLHGSRHRLDARGRGFSSSPLLLIIRRLFLDVSFILTALQLASWLWRKTGLRRREVSVALGILWRALIGSDAAPRTGRELVDKGV